jgi:isopentenyl-diphosphate delta-isomerase
MADPINERKVEHIRVIESDPDVERHRAYFDEVRLRHRALPELDRAKVDPSVEFMGKRQSFPLLISCMTGGDHELLRTINRNLAQAAEETGVAMGVGSQRIMFTQPGARASFEVRRHAPHALLFANLGAAQLNQGYGADQCREAIDVVGADALYLHLNPLQEAVQPEGDTDFSGLADKIGAVAGRLDRPVVVKEVGAGIGPEDVERLLPHGIRYIDVAGAGGTSWSRIEHHRHAEEEGDRLGLTFQDWGWPTPMALRALAPYRDQVTLVASGGIRTGLDMAKAMVLGASLCGMAAPFLKPALESPEAVVRVIDCLKREFVTAMFLLGLESVDVLRGNQALLLDPVPGD